MCKAHYCAEHGRLRQTTSSCECSSSAHSAFYVIGNSNRISYYIKNPLMSLSLIRGKIHSCLCYDERRENSHIIKIIDEFDMKKNNLVKSICNGVFKIAYCIWFFKMFYVISPIFTIITYFDCAHFTINPQILHN